MCIWLRSVSMWRNDASWAERVSMRSAPFGVEGGERVGDRAVDVAADAHADVAARDLDRLALRVEARAPVDDPVAAGVDRHEADAVGERGVDVAAELAAAVAVDARAPCEAGDAERGERVGRGE